MTVDINKFEEICNNGQIAVILTDLEDAANHGNVRCQELLSEAFLMGCYGAQADVNKGFIYTKMAAENGSVSSMNNLSVCYIRGDGTPKNEKASYEWMQEAADQGNVQSFYPVAYKWMWGVGVEGNFDHAEYWARRAVDEGGHVEDARMLLSQLHQFRSGIVLNEQPNDGGQTEFDHAMTFYNQENHKAAYHYFLASAYKGHPVAMNNASVFCMNGYGTEKNEAEAFYWMKKSAESGYIPAFYILAIKYYRGLGVEMDAYAAEYWGERALVEDEQNKANAQSLLEAVREIKSYLELPRSWENGAAEFVYGSRYKNENNIEKYLEYMHLSSQKGYAVAMYNLSVSYKNGEGMAVDFAASYEWAKRAAEAGFGPAMYELAKKYYDGEGTEKDLEQAKLWAQKAINVGENNNEVRQLLNDIDQVLNEQKNRHDNGDEEFRKAWDFDHSENYSEAMKWYLLSAEKGNATAMNNISVAYVVGKGVEVDLKAAFEWMKKSAEAGFGPACHTLAVKYFNGNGTSRDIDLADYWAKRAYEMNGGSADTKEVLRLIEQERRDVKARETSDSNGNRALGSGITYYNSKEYGMAFYYFMEAAKKGNASAMNNVSVCYINGYGVEKSEEEAFYWMKKSAENGYMPAFYTLAVKYYQGLGTERNYEEAQKWANRVPQNNQNYSKSQTLLKNMKNIIKFETNELETLTPIEILNAGLGYYDQKANDKAFSCFLKAAQLGNYAAMNNLSVFYMNGMGTDVDKAAAFEWTKKAAEGGWKSCYYPLAAKYYNGTGVEKNLEQAEVWAMKALEAKDANTQNAQKLLDLVAKAKQQTAQNQSQNAGTLKNYPPQVQEDFEKGRTLYQQQNYKDALLYLEKAAKEGHVEALTYIGEAYYYGRGLVQNINHAYNFLEAAALRGSLTAQSFIARGISGSNQAFLWKAYAKDQDFKGAHEEYIKEITKVRNDTTAWVHPFDASDAMANAAECWKNYLRHPNSNQRITSGGDPGRGHFASQFFFKKALKYGNLDGACGYSLYLQGLQDEKWYKEGQEYYRLAAYFGHSYAMLRMGQYYDSIDRNAANACYQQAARWKYSPAIRVCQERGLDY